MFIVVLIFNQDLESYMHTREDYCNKVHKWFGVNQAEEKRTQTREFLNFLMYEKYST